MCHSLRIRWPVTGWCGRDAPLHKFNKRYYYYILTIIDVLDKHGPYQWKPRVEMRWLHRSKIIRDSGRYPKNLQTDMGKEFYNAIVQELLKKHNINTMQAFVVEWFNRTLKNDMWKQFTHNGNYKWIDLLSRFVSKYNASNYRYAAHRCDSHDCW